MITAQHAEDLLDILQSLPGSINGTLSRAGFKHCSINIRDGMLTDSEAKIRRFRTSLRLAAKEWGSLLFHQDIGGCRYIFWVDIRNGEWTDRHTGRHGVPAANNLFEGRLADIA